MTVRVGEFCSTLSSSSISASSVLGITIGSVILVVVTGGERSSSSEECASFGIFLFGSSESCASVFGVFISKYSTGNVGRYCVRKSNPR